MVTGPPTPLENCAVLPARFVLVVDDTEGRLYAHKRALQELGCTPLVAVSYSQAVRLVGEQHLHCVLIDGEVRTFDPSLLVNVIKIMRPELPVILATGDQGLHAAARMASATPGPALVDGRT